jgi:hypothetical protein
MNAEFRMKNSAFERTRMMAGFRAEFKEILGPDGLAFTARAETPQPGMALIWKNARSP